MSGVMSASKPAEGITHLTADVTDEAQVRADINGDGSINVTDITRIAAHIKGKRLITAASRYNEDDFISDTDVSVNSDIDNASDG